MRWRAFFGQLTIARSILLAVVTFLLCISAVTIMKRAKDWGDNAYLEEERKRNDRSFYIVNALTWISVALVFQILPRIGHRDLSIPAVVFLVGLHFFPVPPLHRHTANLVMGACLMIWAVLCPVVFMAMPCWPCHRRRGFDATDFGAMGATDGVAINCGRGTERSSVNLPKLVGRFPKSDGTGWVRPDGARIFLGL